MAAKMSMKQVLGGSRLLQQTAARRAGSAGRRPFTVAAAAPENERRERLPAAVAAGATLLSGAGAAPAAHAAPQQDPSTVDSVVSQLIDLVKAAGEVAKQGVSAAETGVDYARGAYEKAAPVVKSAVDSAAPVVEKGVRSAVDVAAPALQSGLKEAEKALASSGVPTDLSAARPLVETTEQAVTATRPFVEQALTFLTTTEPVVLGKYALGLLAAYYLLPPVARATAGALRGYAGDVTPASALTTIESEGNAYIVDIRTIREKETGSPDLPNAGKLVELEFAAIEDRRVRSQLRDANSLEIAVTALQVAALKRLSKGSTVLLMDRNGSGTAKAVAKQLARRGFGRVYVIKGGYNGWVGSKLRTKSSSVAYSRVEVLPGTFAGTVGSRGSGTRQLPAPSRNGKAMTVAGGPARRALPSPSNSS